MVAPLQPLLHDAVVVLAAPTQAWSAADGVMSAGIHGLYHCDTRVFRSVALSVDGTAPEHLSAATTNASSVTFTSLARTIDDSSADPRVRVDATRTVRDGVMRESIVLCSALTYSISTTVVVDLYADFAPMQTVKAGMSVAEARVAATAAPGTAEVIEDAPVTIELTGTECCTLRQGAVEAVVEALGAAFDAAVQAGRVSLTWEITIPAKGQVTLGWSANLSDSAAVVTRARGVPEWSRVCVASGDTRLSRWITRGLGDLSALRMATVDRPDETFFAAGAPWFFTLFGRDSIWAARFMLPLGTDIVGSTLRLLAGLQGVTTVNATAEQPGKIMHELRPGILTIPGENVALPPLYYGTVDATALWVTLLVDAWRWGLPDDEVRELLPHMVRALEWIRDYGDSDGDGFLEYADLTGHGLANQGWKDSGDSVQWRDGSLAEGPIALCEVQAYAFEAARGAADVLDHFGEPGADQWRTWAGALAERFRAAFWIPSPDGAYPAIALDASKRPVDTVTSNIGHLLGTGILNEEESALVAARLVSPELNSGFGLRTMSTDSGGFWPLSYHGGSVWTHDTAIAIQGLARDGFRDEAAQLSSGLLAAAEAFDYRMPELHSGDSSEFTAAPAPYPAACRPQAWSAAASVAVLAAALDLRPAGATDLATAPSSSLGDVTVTGLRVAGADFAVTATSGTVEVVREGE
jgi:glycogen debranching enzyme